MNISIFLRTFACISAALAMTACSTKESSFVAAPQDADKGSVVYIYRPSASTNFMLSPKVVIDGNEKFKLGSGDYRYVYLHSGKHTVGLSPTDQYLTDTALEINIEAEQSYYLRVNTSLQFEPDKMNTRRFWIDIVAASEALSEIGKTEYAGPKAQSATAQTGERKDREQFSVDKTQDPFAGKY